MESRKRQRPSQAKNPEPTGARVTERLRAAILSGAYPAGAALRQDELAEALGVSRMPVREALRRLEAEGLVAAYPHRGAFVAALSPQEIAESYELRLLLEREALRLAVPAMTAVTFAEAEALLTETDGESDVGRWGELNRRFHLTLYRPCGRPRLLALIEAEHTRVDRAVRLLLASLQYRDTSQAEHRRLLAACRRGDSAAALAELTDHLADASVRIVRALSGK